MAGDTSSERRHRKHSKHKHRHKHSHHHHHHHSKHKKREKGTEKERLKTKEEAPEIVVDERELQTALEQLEEEMIAVRSIGVQVIHIAIKIVPFSFCKFTPFPSSQ